MEWKGLIICCPSWDINLILKFLRAGRGQALILNTVYVPGSLEERDHGFGLIELFMNLSHIFMHLGCEMIFHFPPWWINQKHEEIKQRVPLETRGQQLARIVCRPVSFLCNLGKLCILLSDFLCIRGSAHCLVHWKTCSNVNSSCSCYCYLKYSKNMFVPVTNKLILLFIDSWP